MRFRKGVFKLIVDEDYIKRLKASVKNICEQNDIPTTIK